LSIGHAGNERLADDEAKRAGYGYAHGTDCCDGSADLPGESESGANHHRFCEDRSGQPQVDSQSAPDSSHRRRRPEKGTRLGNDYRARHNRSLKSALTGTAEPKNRHWGLLRL
jgi:hypothetical protein